jgi:hypothetical protein
MNHPLTSIYWDSTRPLKLLTLFLYPLAAFGMYLSSFNENGDTHLLMRLAPWWVWALMVSYVWCARLVWLIWWEGLKWTRRTTPFFGICFWSFLLASNLQRPETLAFGTMYGICALLEGWILSRAWMED